MRSFIIVEVTALYTTALNLVNALGTGAYGFLGSGEVAACFTTGQKPKRYRPGTFGNS